METLKLARIELETRQRRLDEAPPKRDVIRQRERAVDYQASLVRELEAEIAQWRTPGNSATSSQERAIIRLKPTGSPRSRNNTERTNNERYSQPYYPVYRPSSTR